MPEYLTLPTDELREGDLVLNSGMHILIDGPAKIYRAIGDESDDVYAWPGLVTNADKLCDKLSKDYDPWIACHLRGIWWEDRVPRPRKDNWPIVGNHLATWHVKREPR